MNYGNKSELIRFLSFFLFIVLLGLIIYSPSFHGPFVFDDEPNILFNKHVKIDSLSFAQLKETVLKSPLKTRVIPNISFAINYYIGKFNTIGFRIINFIIHTITAFLSFLLFREILLISYPVLDKFRVFYISAISALLWYIHPIQVQSVAYIVQRMNSMAAMFYIFSFYLYIKGRQSILKKKYKLSIVLFLPSFLAILCAFLSKENTAAFPFMIIVSEFLFFRKKEKIQENTNNILFFILLIFSFCAVSFFYLGWNPFNYILAGYENRNFTLEERLLTQPRVIFTYLSLLYFPNPSRFSLEHDFLLSTGLFRPFSTFLSLSALIGIFLSAVFLYRKKPLFTFSIIWFLLNISIESSFIGLEIFYEHRTYLPSLFLFLLFTLGVDSIFAQIASNNIKSLIWGTVFLILSLFSYKRCMVWASSEFVYRDSIRNAPNSYRVNNNLGAELAKQGRLEEAKLLLEKAVEFNPLYYQAVFNLGLICSEIGDKDESLKKFQRVIYIRKDHKAAYMEMGSYYTDKGDYGKALYYIEKAISIDNEYADAFYELGRLYNKLKIYEAAAVFFSKASDYEEENADFALNAANLFFLNGDFLFANKYYLRALKNDPLNFDIKQCIAVVRKKIIHGAVDK